MNCKYGKKWTVSLLQIDQTSSSLDQMLSSVTNQLPSNGQLENPDEIVMKQEDKSGLYIEEIRTVSNGELKSGWKSDFTGQGRIELVVEISVMNLISMGYNNANSNITTITSQNCDSPLFDHDGYSNNECNCSCDIEDRSRIRQGKRKPEENKKCA